MEIYIPEYVKTILNRLSTNGYESFMVGGCVRDSIMGLNPSDYDVTTSAKPDEILALFPNSLTIGLKHGTVTVKSGKELVEVTTYRCDGTYADHRHPDSVVFVDKLSEDLGRRDFTINAMAINENGALVDLFGGVDDINLGLIRCVGNPDERFTEDALRMFRAYRFSSRYAFKIEDNTYCAIKDNAHLASALAAERIRDELEKILLTNNSHYIVDMISLCLLDRFVEMHPDTDADFTLVDKVKNNSITRWCALCCCLIKYGCISSCEDFLRSLKLDNKTIRCAEDTQKILPRLTEPDVKIVKQLLSEYGIVSCETAFSIKDSITPGNYEIMLYDVIDSGECFNISMLEIDGSDIMKLGFVGPEIKNVLNYLLGIVISNPEYNNKELLLLSAKEFLENDKI